MKSFIAFAFFFFFFLVFCQVQRYPPSGFQYYVPRPTLKAFNPFGFRMSIPDWPGIEKVTFDVKLNQHIPGQTPKEMSFDGQRGYWGNRWSFEDYKIQLNGGDEINFTVTVKKDGKIYKYENGRILVTEHAFSSQESFESGSFDSSEEKRRGHYRYWLWNNQRTQQQQL